jgi:exodeoxyribonuclease VII small subunit
MESVDKKINYSEAVRELESILERLRSGAVGIDELAPAVSRANELVKLCREQLSLTREELAKITDMPL